MSMHAEIGKVITPIAQAWLAHPAGDPLVINKGPQGSIVVTRGFPRHDLTKQEAARRLNCSYRTFVKRYLDTGLLVPNSRRRFPVADVEDVAQRQRMGVL